MKVTSEMVETFREAWLAADAEGRSGNRVRAGLEAVFAELSEPLAEVEQRILQQASCGLSDNDHDGCHVHDSLKIVREVCGAWGGCLQEPGHNMGQADIPSNHGPRPNLHLLTRDERAVYDAMVDRGVDPYDAAEATLDRKPLR